MNADKEIKSPKKVNLLWPWLIALFAGFLTFILYIIIDTTLFTIGRNIGNFFETCQSAFASGISLALFSFIMMIVMQKTNINRFLAYLILFIVALFFAYVFVFAILDTLILFNGEYFLRYLLTSIRNAAKQGSQFLPALISIASLSTIPVAFGCYMRKVSNTISRMQK